MKQNGNNGQMGEYYLGLDIGTDSVGFAATDSDYRLLRHKGNNVWGVRLFDEGQTAEERRLHRVNRRRLARRKWRLHLLRELFDAAITEKDPGFFARMDESFLHEEDKTQGTKFSLFADPDYTDRDYARDYPTVYHLRQALIQNPGPYDVRLVFLALHHIIKSRGHFLFEVDGGEEKTLPELWDEFSRAVEDLGIVITCTDREKLFEVLSDRKCGKTEKGRRLEKLLSFEAEDSEKDIKKIAKKMSALLAGSRLKLSDLFDDEAYAEYSFSVEMSEDEKDAILSAVGDPGEILRCAAAIHNMVILTSITQEYRYICDFKVAEYNRHKEEIKWLKRYVRYTLRNPQLYKEIFVERKEKLNNYAAYSGYRKTGSVYSCSAEDFCKYLKSVLGAPKESASEEDKNMFARIAEGTFAGKLRTSANGVFPNSLHRKELIAILENAKAYLPFLSEKDADGLCVADKICSVFDFRIPYYVGPLNTASKHSWVARDETAIVYPWNFDRTVDAEGSARGFIEKMTSRCTYTGDRVLPKDSLLYSKYRVLNAINNIKVNGKAITVATKQRIYHELFESNDRKVTKKRVESFLRLPPLGISAEDVVSGIDDTVEATLSSYHKTKRLIATYGEAVVEEIIRHIVLFGDDKKILRGWLKNNTALSAEDIQYVSKLRFKEWGSLSDTLLTGLAAVTNGETGEACTVMELLWNTNENLMQILYGYGFIEQARQYRIEHYGIKEGLRSAVEELYVSPKIRRSIWQTMRIIDEIVDTQGAAPKKVFIEVARENGEEGKRTDSRKEQLRALYKKCKMEADELYTQLDAEDADRLRGDKYFLYYAQFGKCMYCGQKIHLDRLGENGLYDIDHIFPRSKIKDDSLDNRVLVHAHENRAKTDTYPISDDIRERMRGWWHELYARNTISKKKLERLTRCEPLSDEELTDFVSRQLVETRQSTKAVAELLQTFLPKTRVVYSKAGNVSDFRKEYGFRKSRAVNDHHHAKDAYLNIVVGNYFDTRFTDAFRRNIRSEKYSINPQVMYRFDVPGAWVAGEEGTIATVKTVMAKNSILYTRQPRTVGGALYKLQPLKAPKGQIPLKKGLPISRYGGYNSATGSYFCLVEYTEIGKRIRALETVLLLQEEEFRKDPQAFARAHWGADAEVILPCIPITSLLEIDGCRMHLRGRSGDSMILVHAYQLAVDAETEISIARIEKYLNRCKEAKAKLPLYPINGISAAENLRLYRMLVQKLGTGCYGKMFSNFSAFLAEKEEDFVALSPDSTSSAAVEKKENAENTLYYQCALLMEILKFFRCNAEYPDLTAVKGAGRAGILTKGKRISQAKAAYLIHQSVTGLYEKKIDLLTCKPMTLAF